MPLNPIAVDVACHYNHWGPHVEVVGISGKFSLFSLRQTITHLLAALHNGPYSVDGALLTLSRWSPGISFAHMRVTKILVWIQLIGLPI